MSSAAATKQPMSLVELETMLSKVKACYHDNFALLPAEEKKKLLEMLGLVADGVKAIQKDAMQSTGAAENEGTILKMCGQFPMDATGSIIVPTKEDLTVALNQCMVRGGNRRVDTPPLAVTVQSVRTENNFRFLLAGPTSPNYLFIEREVYVQLESSEQANFIRELCLDGCSVMLSLGVNSRGGELRGFFQFLTPSQDTVTRAGLRDIGALISDLKRVDDGLRKLGAVPGIGGLPKLSDALVQKEEFDELVKRYQEGDEMKLARLHSYLCTRIRVDKRKRRAALEPLVKERLEILMKLSQFDPDEFPVVIEREFK